jgi:hypothetical protein
MAGASNFVLKTDYVAFTKVKPRTYRQSGYRETKWEVAENEHNRLLNALAEREQNAAAERSSLSEALTPWEAMETEREVPNDHKQNLDEEITQCHHRLTAGQTKLLRLAMNLCRNESVTETSRRSVEVQFRRLEIVEK